MMSKIRWITVYKSLAEDGKAVILWEIMTTEWNEHKSAGHVLHGLTFLILLASIRPSGTLTKKQALAKHSIVDRKCCTQKIQIQVAFTSLWLLTILSLQLPNSWNIYTLNMSCRKLSALQKTVNSTLISFQELANILHCYELVSTAKQAAARVPSKFNTSMNMPTTNKASRHLLNNYKV